MLHSLQSQVGLPYHLLSWQKSDQCPWISFGSLSFEALSEKSTGMVLKEKD